MVICPICSISRWTSIFLSFGPILEFRL
ncbi:hypothetical protein Golax_005249 [Gossypium laxum]|nr:hypothetical protein [Gossypium laxum]